MVRNTVKLCFCSF